MGNGSHLLKGFTLHTSSVFLHLKKHGQLLDSEIAAATGIALPDVHDSISKLVEQGEISRCSVTRFNQGVAVEGIQCRIRGFSPPAAPGRKPATK
jgi:predicted transcriptional regulator